MSERKYSTSIQLSEKQLNILNKIIDATEGRPSNSKILRDAFDYYVTMKYPQLKK